MAEHRQMDMRGTPGVVVIAPRIGAGLDGDEAVVAGGIALGAACAGEVRIQRRRMLVADMDVAAAGIGLPDLDQRVGHAATVLVEHMAVHDDALADRLAAVLGGEIVVARIEDDRPRLHATAIGTKVRRQERSHLAADGQLAVEELRGIKQFGQMVVRNR